MFFLRLIMAELLFRKFIYTILEKLIPTEKCHHHRNQESNERGDKKTTKLCFQIFNTTEGCQFLAGKIRGYYNVVIIDVDFNKFIEKQDAHI